MRKPVKAVADMGEVTQIHIKILVRNTKSGVTCKTLKRLVIKPAARQGATNVQ